MITFIYITSILFALTCLCGWGIIFYELYNNKSHQTYMQKINTQLTEWRIPFINKIVHIEYIRAAMVVFLLDKNSGKDQELGFWENGEWCFCEVEDNNKTNQIRRMLIVIMKRYHKKITFLQKLVNHSLN